jgi:hypothetical protein
MKRTTVLSIMLLIAFFMPWADLRFISFNGFDLPSSLIQFSQLSLTESETNVLTATYAIYLIPLFSFITIIGSFFQIPFSNKIQKVEYYLGLIFSILIIIALSNMNNRVFSFLGIGFYLTIIISVIGIVISDKTIVLSKEVATNQLPDFTTQLTQLKDLFDKQIITAKEYQMKKEDILKKM